MAEGWVRHLAGLGRIYGRVVLLEPLSTAHIEPLSTIGLDEQLWRWTVSRVRSQEDMAAYVNGALRDRNNETAFPYAILDAATGSVAGCTRYGNLDEANRRLEIGWTWIGRDQQRTGVNTETKYLLLQTAFEQLQCIRVEFKTDVLNERSRAALRRIGATEEGILRQHMLTATGRIRDTVYYSILASEWPAAGQRLQGMLQGRQ
jgi:N-acetyltransferase